MGAIIGLSGYSGSGKDYVADAIVRDFPEYKFKKVYFADELKKVAASMLALPIEMMYTQEGKQHKIDWLDNMTVREFLQKYGCAIRNNIHTDFWARKLIIKIKVDENVIVPDMRFPNEFDLIYDVGFCTRINRRATTKEWNMLSGLDLNACQSDPDKEIDKTVYISNAACCVDPSDQYNKWKAMTHESETSLDGHEFDHVYDLNTGDAPVHRERLSKYIFENGYVKF